jgi:flavin-binding protein dodecin
MAVDRGGIRHFIPPISESGLAHTKEDAMPERHAESVYRIVDVVGESTTSWEDAGRRAVETAATSIRDLRVAEVVKMDMKVEAGKVTAFRTRVALSFKYEAQ